MTAPKDTVIVEYTPEPDLVNLGFLFIPSEENQREMRRGTSHVIDSKTPFIYLWGKLVAGECQAPINSEVYFNRHDAINPQPWVFEGKLHYTIPSKFILGYKDL